MGQVGFGRVDTTDAGYEGPTLLIHFILLSAVLIECITLSDERY